jgi:membrane-associated protein
MSVLLHWIQWLIGLAKPEHLKELVNLGGFWWTGYAVMAAIIFSETGLLVGFFLPGDSLLFAAGFLASQDVFNIVALDGILIIAAVVGDAVNYHVGLGMGQYVFERGRLRFVKHSHLMAAKVFYDRHGGQAIVLARFVPVVRTFTPFVAGVARMGYRRFVLYNLAGGAAWVLSMSLAGYWLGQIPWIQRNFELVVIAIVVISVLPIVGSALKHWMQPEGSAKADSPTIPAGAARTDRPVELESPIDDA